MYLFIRHFTELWMTLQVIVLNAMTKNQKKKKKISLEVQNINEKFWMNLWYYLSSIAYL